MNVEIVPSEKLRPSTYNPRKADPERLRLVELSLRKFGFLLPIYADPEGEILSGHQRHYVATEMIGAKRLPVIFTSAMDLETRKGVNILFNRATNDMKVDDTSESITEKLRGEDVFEAVSGLPDIDPESDEFFSCVHRLQKINIEDLVLNNLGFDGYSRAVSRQLLKHGIEMPIIYTDNYKIINGIGRVHDLASRGKSEIYGVYIKPEISATANALLNLLSMDFDVKERYADLLRHNSFRRSRTTSFKEGELGSAFLAGLNVKSSIAKSKNKFTMKNPQHRQKWTDKYGRSILDFGAGRLLETNTLRSYGIECLPFEPFYIPGKGDTIDPDASRALAREFLAGIASGKRFSTIFLSSVLNSVPFYEDRLKILTIIASLCTPATLVSIFNSSVKSSSYETLLFRKSMSDTASNVTKFQLGYEPGITISELGQKPKVQKYHSLDEQKMLCLKFFRKVTAVYTSGCILAECRQPKPVEWNDLEEALRFEFDLPYPDGSRMGLGEEAVTAFKTRLQT